MQQPARQVIALALAEWLPDMLRDQRQRKPDRGHLDQALIAVARLAPILAMPRVAPVG
jgi:hypothetical protein